AALGFYKSILRHFSGPIKELGFGFEMITSSQSPIGGGLGGSSSLVISVLKALHQFLRLPLPATNDLVHLAHNIEAEMLRTPTGKQDYYPAVTGGISVIDFNVHGIQQTVQSVEGTPLKDHFLLVYTGRSHHSGLNNFEVFKSAVKADPIVMDALRQIRDIADRLKLALANQQWGELPELFRQEYDARIQLTPAFTSPEIEKLHDIGLKAGATAVKICGAGGGGCVLVWVAPENRQRVIDACHAADFKCLPAKPVEPL
ncbi:MAG: galactokinase, partial [Bdellovibrionaceae bacterium]|nr:galactokinase [Pseudobdellovibrionaceae bacterium]